MITNMTTNMCGTLMPDGSAQTSVAAGLLAPAVGEPRVVQRAQAQHQPGRRQDAAEHQLVRHLEHEAQQPGQHQQVDEDVGAEAEEGVPVARDPELGLGHRSCHAPCSLVALVMTRLACARSERLAERDDFANRVDPAEDAALRLDHLQAHLVELGEVRAARSPPGTRQS